VHVKHSFWFGRVFVILWGKDHIMPPVKKPIKKRTPNFIAAWRQFKDLSQEQVAERMGVSRTTFGRIENGQTPYNQGTLEGCAEALGVSPSDLLERNPLTEASVDKLRRLLAQATPEQEKTILRVVKSLIENNN
jgi:transcriptional regulator with XRE-family HTH domain